MLFPHLWHLSYYFNLHFLEGTGPWVILTEEIYFLHGFSPVLVKQLSWVPVTYCWAFVPAQVSVLFLGTKFARCFFNENDSPYWNSFSRCCPPPLPLQLTWWLPLPMSRAAASASGFSGLITPDKSYSPCGQVHFSAPSVLSEVLVLTFLVLLGRRTVGTLCNRTGLLLPKQPAYSWLFWATF